MSTTVEPLPAEDALIYAIQIRTPDHMFGWVIIIDDETTVRVAVSGNRVIEREINTEPVGTINQEAWDMVTKTLDLTAPGAEYKMFAVEARIPRLLADRVISAETDLEQNNVINELAVFIGKEITQEQSMLLQKEDLAALD